MKKIFGLILLIVGIILPGLKGNEIKDQQEKDKKDIKENLTPEDEQREIQKKLKGLGYFQ